MTTTRSELHSIADEAYNLVHGERAKSYGHPRKDFKIIAKVWSGLLQDKLMPGEELDEYRVAILMSALKLARLVNSPDHHDSRVDTIGYMLTMERLDEDDNVVAEEPKAECSDDCPFHPTVAELRDRVVAEEPELPDINVSFGDGSAIAGLLEHVGVLRADEEPELPKETVADVDFNEGDMIEDSTGCTWGLHDELWYGDGDRTTASLLSLASLAGPLSVTYGVFAGLVIEKDGSIWWA